MAGLYVHIPYCHSKCAYCDFYSTPRLADMDSYVSALIKELYYRRDEVKKIETVYIGGGTPSIMSPELLSRLVDGIYSTGIIDNILEFTIEANPEDINTSWCDLVKKLNINRVSLGVQTFNDEQLQAINRRHSSTQSQIAIETLQDKGITNISADLIYGLPKQTLDSWIASLNILLNYHLPHFSAYLLSYEPGTRLYAQLKAGKIDECSENLIEQMYKHLIEFAAQKGYVHYEISNFAIPGSVAIHNSSYWMSTPYLGIGVSAYSFDGINRRFNPSNIKEYINAIEQGHPCYIIEPETDMDRYNDYIVTALRTSQGIYIKDMVERWGNVKAQEFIKIAKSYIGEGAMRQDENRIYIAEEYLLISDAIMRDFIIV